jgi:hypothetical protein
MGLYGRESLHNFEDLLHVSHKSLFADIDLGIKKERCFIGQHLILGNRIFEVDFFRRI